METCRKCRSSLFKSNGFSWRVNRWRPN